MRLFNKNDKVEKVRWDGVDWEFEPLKVTHVRNYDLGKAICARNPNIVDYDEWIELQDKLAAEGRTSEAKAMRIPVKPGFELPHVDSSHSEWLDKAVSLGMRDVGRGTPKESLIEFCQRAVGAPPGPPIPQETTAADRRRIDVLRGSSTAARRELEQAGVE